MSSHPSSPDSSLASLQRWMQAVIMHPDGVVAGAKSDDARQHLEAGPESCETVVSRSRNLTGVERLTIYHQAYFARLLECLRNIFPIVAKTVGDEAFDALAMGYLQAHPSQSYTLDRLGDAFVRFLDETRPDRDETGQPTETWPDFLMELAKLEWTIGEVFDGPGSEGRPTLSAEQLAAIGPEHWPEVRLVPAPCLRIMSFGFPVNDYFTELRQRAADAVPPPFPAAETTWLALFRRDYVVRRQALDREQYDLLTALAAGQTVGAAIKHLLDTTGIDVDRLAASLQEWFRTWTAAGFFAAVDS
ncbi:MAG TPA: putative DNA-binding domain-containing protein [Pirellulales bacterium]|nr:putative DNA-binding domain-containing protein [Pirellulales bacterium]